MVCFLMLFFYMSLYVLSPAPFSSFLALRFAHAYIFSLFFIILGFRYDILLVL